MLLTFSAKGGYYSGRSGFMNMSSFQTFQFSIAKYEYDKWVDHLHGRRCSPSPRTKFTLNSLTARATSHTGARGSNKPLVKICGVASPRDAEAAVEAGADFVGMIMWPGSRRSVSLSTAKQISKVAVGCGAKPVGVFVDDDINTIFRASAAANLELVQLHGEGSRRHFPELARENRIIYVLHVSEDGILLNSISEENSACADWILVDSAKGGSGKGFKWSEFRLPSITSVNGWLLAGGIDRGNVCEAVTRLRPDGVDVSSGVCGPNGVCKDHLEVADFMSVVRGLRSCYQEITM